MVQGFGSKVQGFGSKVQGFGSRIQTVRGLHVPQWRHTVAGAKRYDELICWQLSYELQQAVFAITDSGAASRDLKFCDQIRDCVRSSTRNIAEGFGRFEPTEFRRFLRIARGSITETHNHLRDGRDRCYLSEAKYEELSRLAARAAGATGRLMAYLHRCNPKTGR
jgi:four helix bundle protein